MKKILFIIGIASLAACNSNNSSQSSIQGIYVNQDLGSSEFSKEISDTVFIEPTVSNSNYLITRNVCYQRIKDGKLLPVECISKKEAGIFNKDNQAIFIARDGLNISFDRANRLIIIGKAVYKRIN